ncbi:hypothetical protein [Nostoc sp. DedVER01b]|uniref:hypothetical protein n=1 Tax=Nostoc sp. DedVER01b TaxID=3075404 RepID=UPI002AD20DFE|nr:MULTISPECIES: hypothetical protein [unclassified Nostoc]MDZ7988614.1 hypothetical protein [Nostoc sp. DedVER02]MDZ8113644.1 hypothetical protein [Nostoc sp. DedVER01b]
MNPFVGVSTKFLSVPELLNLIKNLATEPSYYFLRWTHKVSKDWEVKPTETDFPMIEGQMFNQNSELRWKQKRKDSYEVLLLSVTGEYPDFERVGEDWQTQDRDAHLYSHTETRFPKGFPSKKLDIAQRYFIDKKTATVHFVALTVGK